MLGSKETFCSNKWNNVSPSNSRHAMSFGSLDVQVPLTDFSNDDEVPKEAVIEAPLTNSSSNDELEEEAVSDNIEIFEPSVDGQTGPDTELIGI